MTAPYAPQALDRARVAKYRGAIMTKFDPAALLVSRSQSSDEGPIIRMSQKSLGRIISDGLLLDPGMATLQYFRQRMAH